MRGGVVGEPRGIGRGAVAAQRVEARAGVDVAGSRAVDGGYVEPRDLPAAGGRYGEASGTAQRDEQERRDVRQLGRGDVHAVGAGPAEGLFFVAEEHVDPVAEHLQHAVAEGLDHTRVREGETGQHALGFRDLAGPHGRGAAGARGSEIALDVQVTRPRERRRLDIVDAEEFRGAEEGVHRAFGVVRYEDQAAPGLARAFRVVCPDGDARCRDVGEEPGPGLVTGDAARVIAGAPEGLHGVDGVRGGATAHAFGRETVEGVEESEHPLLVDEGHVPLRDLVVDEEPVVHRVLDVEQGRADAVDVVTHAARRENAPSAASRVWRISASPCAPERNAASNADGAKYTPASSMAWKKRL